MKIFSLKKSKPIYPFIRILSTVVILVLLGLDRFHGRMSFVNMAFDILCGSAVCLFYPSSYEDNVPSLLFSLAAVVLLPLLAHLSAGTPYLHEIVFSCNIILFVGYMAYRVSNKYRNVKTLFRIDSVWRSVEDYASLLYSCCFAVIAVVMVVLENVMAPKWVFLIMGVVVLAFYIAQLVRAHTGSTLFISAKKEKKIKEIIKANIASGCSMEPEDQLSTIYGRVLKYMENKKPYLDSNFTIEDMSAAVYCNKAYLSKAINFYSGRNFRQFVNYYRVNYSISLMKKDRRLKVIELAAMSGFCNCVTYNMAFKLLMNATPSAYATELRAKERMLRQEKRYERVAKPIPLEPDPS